MIVSYKLYRLMLTKFKVQIREEVMIQRVLKLCMYVLHTNY